MTKSSTIKKWKQNVNAVSEKDFNDSITATDSVEMDKNWADGLIKAHKSEYSAPWAAAICRIDGLPQDVRDAFGCIDVKRTW